MLHGCRVSKRAPSVSHLLFADDSFFFFQTSISECEVMNDILACYERDSDQAVNLQKSGIFFSTNIKVKVQDSIKHLLNVYNPLTTGRYLGLPSLIGYKKRFFLDTFEIIDGRDYMVGIVSCFLRRRKKCCLSL